MRGSSSSSSSSLDDEALLTGTAIGDVQPSDCSSAVFSPRRHRKQPYGLWWHTSRCGCVLCTGPATRRTQFGWSFAGERSVRVLHDDAKYMAFRNIKPYAPLAALVIPKRFVEQDPMGLGAE
eukprot:914470-Prymnesium_polylepis.1